MEFPLKTEDLVNFLYLLYRSVREAIQFILENTLLKAIPTVAAKYAEAITLLTMITAVLLILELVSSAKKALAILVALSWVLLTVSIVIALYMS